MNFLTHLLSPEMLRLMAMTLLHFLWQGTALAALAYVGMAFCRSASSRYAIGVAFLALMVAAPGLTLFTLLGLEHGGAPVNAPNAAFMQTTISSGHAISMVKTPIPAGEGVPAYFLWPVEMWFVGVMLFSLRSAGGVLVVERLRRAESRPVREELLNLCLTLQDKMGLQRLVRFSECIRLEAPAVAGWLQPVVLLPVSALTGLSEAQLSSVIAHELAHIKRFDSFVNLFQIAVETLLFYHPGVWWLNKRIREERENCCDDMAVVVCGSPLAYAHALARMAESRTSPRFIMAANSRPLAARVARLLGVGNSARGVRGTDLSLGVLCLSVSLIAGVAFIGVARNVKAQGHVQAPFELAALAHSSENTIPSHISIPAKRYQVSPMPKPLAEPTLNPLPEAILAPAPASVAIPQTPANAAQTQGTSSSYIDGLKAAGLTNLTVDQIIGLKIQGVTPEYVKSIHDLGLQTDADTIMGMKIQGITPDYARAMREATGQPLDADELVGLKIQGVTPEYVKQIHELGLKADSEEIMGMKIQGISPEYVREMRKLDLKPDTNDLIGMKVQGITPEYVKEIDALGLHPDVEELIGMKVQGVDADYLKKMQAAGFKLDVDDAIGAKVQGVTPEFVEKLRSHGFKDLSLNQLIALKQSGVLD
jgi:beta-lactamase regulating signal transducer with metallopeptidase domain